MLFRAKNQTQDSMFYPVMLSLWFLLIWNNSYVFLTFMNLTFFKDYRPVILQNTSQFGFVQCLMIRPRFCMLPGIIQVMYSFLLHPAEQHTISICALTGGVGFDDFIKLVSICYLLQIYLFPLLTYWWIFLWEVLWNYVNLSSLVHITHWF